MKNSLACSVHLESIFMRIHLARFSLSYSYVITIFLLLQVHITQGDYDGKAVIISWVTSDEPGSSEVQYGTTKGQYDRSAEGNSTSYTFYKYKSGYIHRCLLDGLEVILYLIICELTICGIII